MSKALFTLVIPDPEVRKKYAPPSKKHKNHIKYSRKQKHKTKEAPDNSEASFVLQLFFYTNIQ